MATKGVRGSDKKTTKDGRLPLLIVGTGAEARVVAETLAALGDVVYGFLTSNKSAHDDDAAELNDVPVLGSVGEAAYLKLIQDQQALYIIMESDAALRKALMERIFMATGVLPATVTHPTALVSPTAEVAQGCYIGPFVVVEANAVVGAMCVLNSGAVVEADAQLADGITLGAGARVGQAAQVAAEVYIGAGAVVAPKVTIGKKATVAPGAVVLKSVADKAQVAGNPATVLS